MLMSGMKRRIKDSVFTYLFGQPEYMLELYKTLHPEDPTITIGDLELVTLKKVVSNGIYNDLAIIARNTLILLVEAQSTFSVNIVLRLFMYLAVSYQEYAYKHKLDLYSAAPLEVPTPELFVVYTGNKKYVPDTLYLSDLFSEPDRKNLEMKVKVLRSDGSKSIIDQYIRFCKITDKARKKYGSTKKAIEEAIKQCMEQGVLEVFLMERKKEVINLMDLLFDQERIDEIREYNIAKKSHAEGMEAGREEGREEEKEERISAMVTFLKSSFMSFDEIKNILINVFEITSEAAEEKLGLYWDKEN